MRLTLRRQLLQSWLNLTLCLLLVACGGSGGDSVSDTPTGQNPPESAAPVLPPVGDSKVEMGVMVAFGYNALAAGAPLRTHQVQNLAVGNGTANYRFPRSGESTSGNLTLSVDVADPDGIARVLVGFNGSEQALILCDNNCGTSFSRTVTGVNPRNFGLTPGSLRLELWLEDLLGNRIMFDARDIEWLPEPVVGVNTSRSAGALQVNWTANSSARRYNLYIAEQPGISPENILSKTGGRQFLALNQTGFSIPALEDNRRYFVLVTGVDASGESLFSEQHVIQPVGAPEFSLPVAQPDQFSLNEDEEFRGFLLENDSHPDDRSFSLDSQPIRPPDNGSVVLNANGTFVYKPRANFAGSDSFIYQITDTQGLTAQALVSLSIVPVNDIPVASDDNYSLAQNTSLIIAAPGVLANDFDIDGDTLTVDSTALISPAQGTLQLKSDGGFSYTPNLNYRGEDSFTYQLRDGQGGVAQAKVTLRVGMTNAAPVAQNDSYQLLEDEQLVVTAAQGILANDSDPDGDSIRLVTDLLSTVKNGQLLLATDGSFKYIPNQDFFGMDSFTYQISDPSGLVSSATVALMVLAQNDPPVVQTASYSIRSNTSLSILAPGLLNYAFDVDDEDLILAVEPVVAPTKGTVSLEVDGSFTYTAHYEASGTDSFIFRVLDDDGASGTGTVVINFVTQGVAPVLNNATFQIFSNKPDGFLIAQLLALDSDANDTLTFSIVSGNESGLFSLSASGLLRVADATQLIDQSGTIQSLVVQVQDSYGLIAQAAVDIAVSAGPVAANSDNYTLPQNTTFTVASPGVLGNDVESSGATLTATLVSPTSYGQLSLNADGSFVYVPFSTFYGQDYFVYQASNGVDTSQVTVTLTVTQTSSSLQANFDTYTLNENTLLTVSSSNSLLLNDIFNPNESFAVSLVQGPPHGTLSLNSDGTFSYQPATGAYGSFYFTYRLTQGGLTSDAQVELNIIPANASPSLQDATATISNDYLDLQPVLTLTLYDSVPGSYSYEILSGNIGSTFSITSGGVITVANSAELNAVTTYHLLVKVTKNNDSNLTDVAMVTIHVTALLPGTAAEVVADISFASGGELSLQMMLSGEYNDPVEIIPLSDGGSLVIGTVHSASSQEIFVMRLTANGSVDTSYADQGLFRDKILSVSTEEESVAAVLTGTDELVILANYTDGGGSGFFLLKLNSSGELDTTFGGVNQGYVLCTFTPCDTDTTATDLIINSDGDYVVAGTKANQAFLYKFDDEDYQGGWDDPISALEQFDMVLQDSTNRYYGIGQSTGGHIVVARFLSTFALDDPAFGPGYQVYDFSLQSSVAKDAVIYNDDLYVVGSVTDALDPTSPDALFFKIKALDGGLDSAFGLAGFLQINGNGDKPLLYQSIGHDATDFYILTSTEDMYEDVLSLSRYSLTGLFELDEAFSGDGALKAVQLQVSGPNLWLLGQLSDAVYGATNTVSFSWVGKYQVSTLSADSGFSANGQRWFNAGFSSDTLLGTRKLTMGTHIHSTLFYGYSSSAANGTYEQAFVGRLTENGTLDHSFGNHGVVLLTDEELSRLSIKSILEGANDTVYVAGYGVDSNDYHIGFVARLAQDGKPDFNFSGGLTKLMPADLLNYDSSSVLVAYDNSAAVQLKLNPGGKLVVGAEYAYDDDHADIALLQLNANGTLDSSFGSSGYAVFNALDPDAETTERLSKMMLDPVDDSIVIAGQYRLDTDPQVFVARFTDSGLLMNNINSPSGAFGTLDYGYELINLTSDSFYSEYVNGLAFDASRKLVLAVAASYETDETHYLYRLDQYGVADASFNSGQIKPITSFSDSVVIDLEIRDIQIDDSGRLLMVGIYGNGDNAWIGRVLMNGSGNQPGRWDPSFEPGSATEGAYVFTGLDFTPDLSLELTEQNRLMLGWSKAVAPRFKFSFRQFLLD